MDTSGAIVILQGIAEQATDGRIVWVAEDAMEKNLGMDKAMMGLRQQLDKTKKLNQELLSSLEALGAKSGNSE